MKNLKNRKLSFILALCLAFSIVFTVIASAETTGAGAINSNGVMDFEGATVGDITTSPKPVVFTANTVTSAGIVEVDGRGNVFEYRKTASGTGAAGAQFYLNNGSNVNTSIIEAKVRFVSGSNRVRFYPASTGNSTSMISNAVDFRLDGTIVQVDNGGWKTIEGVKKGDWFDIKFVYYEGDEGDGVNWTNRKLELYVNGTLVREITTFNRNYLAENVGVLCVTTVAATVSTVQIDDIKVTHKDIKTPEIMSVNVSYESDLHLLYAVPKKSVSTGEAPKLMCSTKHGDFTVTDYTEAIVNNVDCYVFKGVGVPIKEMNTELTVKVVAGEAESESLTYSVEKYFYERLYDDGFVLEGETDNTSIGVNDGKDLARKKLYYKYLEIGALAQEVLLDGVDDPVGGVPYVSINGTTQDVSGEFALGTTFTLEAATVEGKTLSHFAVVTSDAFGYEKTESAAQAGDVITVTGFTLVYPVWAE